jgi:hypothetical protein
MAACSSSGSQAGTQAAATQPAATQASTTTASTPQHFVSDRYGFRVTLPGGWSGTDATIDWPGESLGGLGSPLFANTTDPTFSRYFVAAAAPLPTGMDLAGWKAAMVRGTPAVCSDPSPGEQTTLGGEPALAWTHTCSDGYDVNLLAALHEGHGYVMFLASKSANDDAEDRRLFESIRTSLGFTR